jgi:hypothetical protein
MKLLLVSFLICPLFLQAMDVEDVRFKMVSLSHLKDKEKKVEYFEMIGELESGNYITYTNFLEGFAKGTTHCTLSKSIDNKREITLTIDGRNEKLVDELAETLRENLSASDQKFLNELIRSKVQR